MKKVVSILMSLMLMTSLCPSAAYASIGDLSVGVHDVLSSMSSGGYVADRVYAIIGNDYAMMISETESSQTIDIIDSSYSRTLSMTADMKPNEYGYVDTIPTSRYWYDKLLAHGMCVSDKDSKLYGMVSLDGGTVIIPCSYEFLTEDASGTYALGISSGTGAVKVMTVLSQETGAKLAETSIGEANSAGPSMSGNTVVVWRYGSTTYRDVYEFDGTSLALKSSEVSGASNYEMQICKSIVQKGVFAAGASYPSDYEYYDASGTKIQALVGWRYCATMDGTVLTAGEVVSGGFLFANNSGQAKIVNDRADAVVSFSYSDAAVTPSYFNWGTVGYYVSCEPSNARSQYYSKDGSLVLDLDNGQHLSTIPSGIGYYSSARDGGQRRYVSSFDADLKQMSGAIPALGSRALVLPGGDKAYRSGLDEDGYLSYGLSSSDPNLLAADGSRIILGGASLTQPHRSGFMPESTSEVQFGGKKDAYCVVNDEGRYGLVSSAGKAIVPVSYVDYFSGTAGCRNFAESNRAMVKSANGAWQFITVQADDAVVPDVGYDSTTRPSSDMAAQDGVRGGTASQGESGLGPTVASAIKSDLGPAVASAIKAANPMKVKASSKSLKAKQLKKKAKSVSALKVTRAVGKVTYKNVSAKKALKRFKVASKTGKITVPKGTKKGTYKVKVKVAAAGDATHGSAAKTVTCKIVVK